mmetsp:Transcript_2066/g.1891  ORF Transcript_2066/g.1891 Transcript_2066/m.1891 type:complete len:188 (-) Transcript_2066:336-899(-)
MDIKPSSLLMGEDFRLKLANFDKSYHLKSSEEHVSSGTKSHRAPEVKTGCCQDPFKADIFNLGLVLFFLKFGISPCCEDVDENGKNLYELMLSNFEGFWSMMLKNNEAQLSECDKGIKKLIGKLVKSNPQKRLSLEKIKRDDWMKGDRYTVEELKELLKEKIVPRMKIKLLRKENIFISPSDVEITL